MKTIIRIACSFIWLAVIGVGPASETGASVGKTESVAESMRRLSGEIISAYERRDAAALKGFYARQLKALFFWERRMSYSWEKIEQTMDELVRLIAKIKLTTGEFRSGGSGNTGWFATTFHAERVTPEGQTITSDGRWTVVAEKINGRWLIVHEHTSFPLPER